MSFIDTRFPVTISFGSTGGPIYKTSVISMRSGREKRNAEWAYPRHEYDASSGVKRMSDVEDLIAFFHVVLGRAHTFRWKDWGDYKSCKVDSDVANTDQTLTAGDGETVDFQLKKTYSFGAASRVRNITKPVSGTVVMAVNGASVTNFTVDTDTGIVTFTQSTWAVTALEASSSNDFFCIAGDHTGDIVNGTSIAIAGSTGNDGVYTVFSTVYDDGNSRTEIHVSEQIPDVTVDGSVKYGQPSDGAVVTAGYEFDVHARLETDELPVTLQGYKTGEVSVPVIEIKEDET